MKPANAIPYVCALVAAVAFAASAIAHPKIFTDQSLAQAKKTAQEQGKLLLVDFGATWCGPCREMEKNTWSDPTVESWVESNAIAIQVDIDQDKQTASALDITAVPTLVVYQPTDETKEFDRQIGYQSPSDLIDSLNQLKNGHKPVHKPTRTLSDSDRTTQEIICLVLMLVFGFALRIFWSTKAYRFALAVLFGVCLGYLVGLTHQSNNPLLRAAYVLIVLYYVAHLLANFELKRGRPLTAMRLTKILITVFPWAANTRTTLSAAQVALKQYAEAIKQCDKAIALAPTMAMPYNNRAAARIGLKQFDLALQDANKAISLKPDFAIAYSNRAAIYNQINEYDKALQDCDKAISLKGKIAHPRINRIVALSNLHRTTECLQDADQLIQDFPVAYSAFAYGIKAHSNIQLYKYDQAIVDCDRAIAVNRAFVTAYCYKAHAKMRLNRLDEANANCLLAKQFKLPNEATSVLVLIQTTIGALHLRKLEFNGAVEELSQAVELDGSSWSAHILRSDAYAAVGDFKKAEADNQIAEKLEHDDYQRSISLAVTADRLRLMGESDKAIAVAHEAVGKFPDQVTVLSTLGTVLTRSGKHAEALPHLNRAIELDPYYAEAYWFRHEAYEALGETEKAAADKKVAVDFDYKPPN